MRRGWIGFVVLLALSAAAFFVGIGEHGFRSTEGHRVVPGWEMLETGEVFPTRMFERVYVRKPPGTPWLIGVSGWIFGESEWSARVPSAVCGVLMVLVSWAFGRAWFGARGAVWAAGATLCTATLWFAIRSAEIEAQVVFGTQVAALGLVHVLVWDRGRWWGALAVFAGVVAMALTKGPAGVPVLVGAAAAGWWFGRRLGGVRGVVPGLLALAGAFLVLGLLAIVGARALSGLGEGEVERQGVDEFVNRAAWFEHAAFVPMVFGAGLPISLALLVPWGRDAGAEAVGEERRLAVGRALAAAWVIGVAVYAMLLLGNPRYGMPAQGLLGPVVGYAAWALGREGMRPARGRVLRAMGLVVRLPRVGLVSGWALVLVGVWVWWLVSLEPSRGADSGREPGRELAAVLLDGDEVWASGMVNARPELLLYARGAMEERGDAVRVRWMPREIGGAVLPGRGGVLVLKRRRGGGGEVARYEEAHPGRLERVHEGRVHEYGFVVLRVVE